MRRSRANKPRAMDGLTFGDTLLPASTPTAAALIPDDGAFCAKAWTWSWTTLPEDTPRATRCAPGPSPRRPHRALGWSSTSAGSRPTRPCSSPGRTWSSTQRAPLWSTSSSAKVPPASLISPKQRSVVNKPVHQRTDAARRAQRRLVLP